MTHYFYLTLKYAPAEARSKIEALAGQFIEEIEAEADFKNKAAVFQALLRDAGESRRILATPWHWLGRRLGLVNILRDV